MDSMNSIDVVNPPLVLERQVICSSEDGTFWDAQEKAATWIGQTIAGYIKTHLYQGAQVEILSKRNILAEIPDKEERKQIAGVIWRVVFYFYLHEDGKVHEEIK